MTTLAVAYIRRSKQADERVVSLAVQRSAVEKYAAEQGWTLVALVEHDGISGGRRGRFQELDAALRTHAASRVITYHLDRFARDCAGLLDWLASASRRGIELHEVGRGKRAADRSSDFLGIAVEGAVAEHYRLVIAEKTSDALQRIKAEGKRWTRVAPYGVRWSADGRHAVANRTEKAIVERARRLQGQGASLRKVSALLAREGHVNRDGRPFHPQTLARMLA